MKNRPDPSAVKEVGSIIRNERRKRMLDRAPTAVAAGLNDRTLGRIETGTQDDGVTPYAPSEKSLLAICIYLELDPLPLFEKLGYEAPDVPLGPSTSVPTSASAIVQQLAALVSELGQILESTEKPGDVIDDLHHPS